MGFEKSELIFQYYSKWRNCWVDFKVNPTVGEINKMIEFNYQIKSKNWNLYPKQ